MLPWSTIDSVFLDMDGTLLDLNFDNHFWQEYVPLSYAKKNQLPLNAAKDKLYPIFQQHEGTIQWYSVDFWSETLDLDIAQLKAEVSHLIAVHPHVINFLEALRAYRKRTVLVTNAHHKSIQLKLQHTPLANHLDHIICAHDIGIPKEHADFWQKLQTIEPFQPDRTLFIDDSLSVLRSAQAYGIKHLLCIAAPDSQGPNRNIAEFMTIQHFRQLLPITMTEEI